jgi:hypothetical protein
MYGLKKRGLCEQDKSTHPNLWRVSPTSVDLIDELMGILSGEA